MAPSSREELEKEAASSSGPPYLPPYAAVGGTPSFDHDFFPCIIFLILFAQAAIIHMTLFLLNKRRNRKFIFSVPFFVFCMARITAISMRMAWASHPNNPHLAIAANVFVLLGGVILIIVHLFFTQRLLRAIQPRLGWNPRVNKILWVIIGSIVSALLIIMASTVHYFFTLDAKTRSAERILLLTASTWLTSLAFLPVVAIGYLLWCLFNPAVEANQIENFGEGSLQRKIWLLLSVSALNTLGAGFRLGANFDARPIGHAAWYHSRAAFYVFNFSIETLIVYAYFICRIDKLFWVPNGAKGPGDYDPGRNAERPRDEERPDPPAGDRREDIPLDDLEPDRPPAAVAEPEASDRTAVPSSDASGTTKPPGQTLSPGSSRALRAGSYSTAPQSSTSESGAQASSSAASGIRPPIPSFSWSDAQTATGSGTRPAESSSSPANERGTGAATADATAGAVDNTGNTTTSRWARASRFRFEENEEPGGVTEGDGEGGSGSSGQPSIRPASSVYSTDNGNPTDNGSVTPGSSEPSWFRGFLRESLARLEESGGDEQWDRHVQVHDRNTPTVVTRSEQEVDIPLRISLSGVTEEQEQESEEGTEQTREQKPEEDAQTEEQQHEE